jgi:hypothetical protein
MYKLLAKQLRHFRTSLFWLIRGGSDVDISLTDNRLYLKLATNDPDTTYTVHVDEIAHRVRFKRFYIPDKVKLLYRVRLTHFKNDQVVETWENSYPELIEGRSIDPQLVLNFIAGIHLERYFDPEA